MAAFVLPACSSVKLHALQSQGANVFDALQQNTWYLPTADGKTKLYVTSLGSGPLVVTLHGGPGNDFNYLVDAVRPHMNRYQFVFYDQRGSLLSPVASDQVKNLSVKMMVEDLETLRQALGEDKIVIFAHSWGTLLALSYYQAHPEHVEGLVLAASFPAETPPGKTFTDTVKAMHARLGALRQRPEVKQELHDAGVDAKDLSPKQKSMRHQIEGLASFNIFHIERWRQFEGGGVYYNEDVDSAIGDTIPERLDFVAAVREHPLPITVIDGDKDYLDPAAMGWTALSKGGQVHVDVVKDASHYVWLDDPQVFAKDLGAGLASAFRGK